MTPWFVQFGSLYSKFLNFYSLEVKNSSILFLLNFYCFSSLVSTDLENRMLLVIGNVTFIVFY